MRGRAVPRPERAAGGRKDDPRPRPRLFSRAREALEDRIVLAVGGDQTRREFFVAWLETQREAATVFDVVTPEKTYKRVTLTEYSVRRTAESGTASRIIAECTFEEIREAVTTYYVAGEDTADTTNASDAADTPTSETGFVQTITYTAKTAMESVTAYVSGAVQNVSNTISNITGS